MQKINFIKWEKLENDRLEQVNTLYANLQFCGDDVKCLGVISSLPDEGKTFISMELLRAYANDGKKVILIDADLRKSRVASRYANVKQEHFVGLSSYLLGKAEIENIITETDIENAHIIIADNYINNPTKLLNKPQFDNLINSLKAKYDMVLIDMPPVNSVVDGAVVSSKCDAVVLVVKCNSTNYKAVQFAKKELSRANVRILGVVLNKIDRKVKEYYYTKGTYYSYSNYRTEKKKN